MGHWARWLRLEAAGGAEAAFTAQYYNGGELCDGGINRATTLYFHCNASAATPKLTRAREVSMCQYELHADAAAWCALEAAGVAAESWGAEAEEEGEEEGEGEEEEEAGAA